MSLTRFQYTPIRLAVINRQFGETVVSQLAALRTFTTDTSTDKFVVRLVLDVYPAGRDAAGDLVVMTPAREYPPREITLTGDDTVLVDLLAQGRPLYRYHGGKRYYDYEQQAVQEFAEASWKDFADARGRARELMYQNEFLAQLWEHGQVNVRGLCESYVQAADVDDPDNRSRFA